LIATHRPEEAVRLCNKVLVIDNGRLKGFDRIAELSEKGMSLLEYYRERLQADTE
jgi:ABC-type multidrug transport system ATPase subunit